MTNTQSTTVDGSENDALARELYNTIMADIEPDLLLENLANLNTKYEGESEITKSARLKRYEEAYAKFDVEFQKFMNDVDEQVRVTRRAALHEKEQAAQQGDQPLLSSLEEAFR